MQYLKVYKQIHFNNFKCLEIGRNALRAVTFHREQERIGEGRTGSRHFISLAGCLIHGYLCVILWVWPKYFILHFSKYVESFSMYKTSVCWELPCTRGFHIYGFNRSEIFGGEKLSLLNTSRFFLFNIPYTIWYNNHLNNIYIIVVILSNLEVI